MFFYTSFHPIPFLVSPDLEPPLCRSVRKISKSDYYLRHVHLSVRPSVCMEQLDSHFTNFDIREIFENPPRQFKFNYNLTGITGTMLIKIQPDATVCRYLFYCKVIVHVSGVTVPIMSTKNCNRSLRYRS
jgi:hypothetical protein